MTELVVLTPKALSELTGDVLRDFCDRMVVLATPVSPWLDTHEAAEYLRMSEATLYRLRREGLPFSRAGGRLLFNRHELDNWVKDSV